MEQYIKKSAVENILRNLWQTDNVKNSEHRICYNKALQEVQCELDTLEVKEVEEPSKDLEEAADTYVKVWYKIHNLDAESYPIDVKISKTDFIAGAKWYKEQLKRLKEE